MLGRDHVRLRAAGVPLVLTAAGDKKPAMTAQFFGAGAKLHEFPDALGSANENQDPAGFEPHAGHRRGDQFSSEPLPDNGDARMLAQPRFAQGLARQDTFAGDAYFSDL